MQMPPELHIEGLSATDALLITGPPHTDKFDLLVGMLASQCERLVLISTREDAQTVRTTVEAQAGIPPEQIGVVDCTQATDAAGTVGSGLTAFVDTPSNLTEIGVAFTDLHERFQGTRIDGQTGVGLHSLSQVVMHSDAETVYQFLEILLGQARSSDWFSAIVLDSAAVEIGQPHPFEYLFDGILETRTTDAGQREFRSREFTSTASEWQPF